MASSYEIAYTKAITQDHLFATTRSYRTKEKSANTRSMEARLRQNRGRNNRLDETSFRLPPSPSNRTPVRCQANIYI